jgi:hypothetical protein
MIQRSFVIDPKYVLTRAEQAYLQQFLFKKNTIYGQKGLRSGIIWSRTQHHVEQKRVEQQNGQNEKQKAEKHVANIITWYFPVMQWKGGSAYLNIYILIHHGSYGIVDVNSATSYHTNDL